jgi:glycosyltransferase involved in cell wall biosynthesis
VLKACVVIPVYNHEQAIGRIVGELRALGLPVILVDDGSDASCAQVLDALAERLPDVELLRLPRNQGKGAAVMAGLAAAARAHYTHALQIDADGQHRIQDATRFLAVAAAAPDAVVCGEPLFDASIPRSRRYLRYLTHAMVWVNTLSRDIRDSMCGFRVYPLAQVLPVFAEQSPGRRMDFDVEALVRLHWHGVPLRWVVTPVTYPRDGVSHFRLVRDNVLITAMHTRLFFGMVRRLPRLLGRRLAPSVAQTRVST